MGVMTIPDLWSGQDRMLTVFELRSGAYEQAAHIAGDEEYDTLVPFPVTLTPSALVTVR